MRQDFKTDRELPLIAADRFERFEFLTWSYWLLNMGDRDPFLSRPTGDIIQIKINPCAEYEEQIYNYS